MAMQNYSNYINAAASKYGVSPALLMAMMGQESSGDPNAVSPKGAGGLMQIMPATAQDLGITNVMDPAQNIDGGANYISQLINRYGGDQQKALGAYNYGEGNIDRLTAGGKSYSDIEGSLPAETQNYVAAIQKKNEDTGSDQSAAAAPQSTTPSIGSSVESMGTNYIKNKGINAALGSGGGGAANGTAAAMGVQETAGGEIIGADGSVIGNGVGSAMNGGTMLSDGSVLGGTPAAGTGFLAAAAPFAAAGIAAYTGSKALAAYEGSKGKGVGGGLMSSIEGNKEFLAVPMLGQAVWAAGALGGSSSGKSKDQQQRDAVRKAMQGQGFLDSDYQATLADGSKYDMGKDGNARLSDGRRVQEADFNNPMTPQTVGWTNTIGAILGGGDPDKTSYWSGYLSNAAESNSTTLEGARQNVLTIAKNMGLDQDTITQGLLKLKDGKFLTNDQYNAMAYGAGTLFSGKYDQNAAEDSFQANKTQGGSAVVAAMKPTGITGDRAIAQPQNDASSLANSLSGFGGVWSTMPANLPSSPEQSQNNLVGSIAAQASSPAKQAVQSALGSTQSKAVPR